MLTGGPIQVNGRRGVPTPAGGAADAGNRERLTRALLAGGDRFAGAVRSGAFYRLLWGVHVAGGDEFDEGAAAVRFRRSLTREDVPVSCRDCAMQVAENRQINKALGLGPRAARRGRAVEVKSCTRTQSL